MFGLNLLKYIISAFNFIEFAYIILLDISLSQKNILKTHSG